MKNELNKSLRKRIGQALGEWHMINEGDKVLVGLSGGKDSLVLLQALHEFQARSPVKFSLAALSVKLTGMNTESPCSFCANMRRGILSSWASKNSFNKLALGHSLDDAVETFFMNLFQTGRAKSFQPVAYMSRTNVTVIRPFVLSTEAAIIDEAKRLELPIIPSACPYAGHTKRQETREFIAKLRERVPDLYVKILHALRESSWRENFSQPQYLQP